MQSLSSHSFDCFLKELRDFQLWLGLYLAVVVERLDTIPKGGGERG